MVGGDAIFNPFQWGFGNSPQFIRERVQFQNHCSEGLQNDRYLARSGARGSSVKSTEVDYGMPPTIQYALSEVLKVINFMNFL